ncbi:50S ribosomal protein L25 [Bacteriovoracaceae bacterium]|nr:50S ribosomal protein L25 [Bacteriovoracaceae bacterium]
MKTLNIKQRNLESKPHNLRNQELIPGVVYGPSVKNMSIYGTNLDMERALFDKGEVFKIPLNGKKVMVKFNEVQRDPVTRGLIHFSLMQLREGVECTVEVPVNFKGTPNGVKKGGVFVVLKEEIEIAGKPKKIPKMINANISKMDIGEKLTVKDLRTPPSIQTAEDDHNVVAICKPPTKQILQSVGEIDYERLEENRAKAFPGFKLAT